VKSADFSSMEMFFSSCQNKSVYTFKPLQITFEKEMFFSYWKSAGKQN